MEQKVDLYAILSNRLMLTGILAILGVLLGFTLGLVGGGGSVLGVPILVYVSGVSVKEAIVMTLLVLAIAGLVGVCRRGVCD